MCSFRSSLAVVPNLSKATALPSQRCSSREIDLNRHTVPARAAAYLVESPCCDCCWKVCQAATTTLMSWILSAADRLPRSTRSRRAMAPTSTVASSHACHELGSFGWCFDACTALHRQHKVHDNGVTERNVDKADGNESQITCSVAQLALASSSTPAIASTALCPLRRCRNGAESA